MALNVTSNFNGDVVEELMMLAVTDNEIVDGGHIYVEDDIQFKRSVPRVRQSEIIQDMAATPTSPKGAHTFDELTLQPDPYLVYIEFDPEDLRKMWQKWAPDGQFVFQELPTQLQTELLKMLLEGENGVNTYMGSAILNGKKVGGVAPFNKFNGIIYKAEQNSDVVDIQTPAELTSSNIIEKMRAVYEASRIPVRNSPDYAIVMSVPDHEKYREALVTLTYKSIDETQAAPEIFRGKKLVVLSDMPENTMFATYIGATRKSNIWLGCHGYADYNTIKVDRVQNNSDLWFFKMKMSADTLIKWGQDFVLYRYTV
jgi:hypothetical protein